MAASEATRSISERLDSLNEFERQPVSEDKLQGGLYFAGSFAGEHVAATEFVIGALFVSAGATTYDVIVGLLIGNLLAVLSWALICAPIAVRTRLTLYWYLRPIVGPVIMVIFNVVNGIMYCALGGAMITVAASAVRIPFGIPEQTKWYPEDARFVLVVWLVGAVVVTLAILGFKRLAQFAMLCSPWMLLMFVAGGLLTLPLLGDIHGLSDFWRVAQTKIWTGPAPGQTGALGFWHIAAFAWVCNQGMHLGLTDMALLRYARRKSYGLYSACGMYLGHYVAWICAGVMGAAAASVLGRPLAGTNAMPGLDSGSVAYVALGAIGALAVVIAGWTTANPMLYRAGLAFQVVTPGWPRWKLTLVAGVITTLIACSPFVFTKMLDFVALYGLMIMPMGAIVVMEHWVFPRIGFSQFWATSNGRVLNWPALVAWLGSLAVGIVLWQAGIVHLFFLVIPVWLMTSVSYVILAGLAGAREVVREAQDEIIPVGAPAVATHPESDRRKPTGGNKAVFYLSGFVALACLVLCLALPIGIVFAPSEGFPEQVAAFKSLLLWLTPIYFISGVIWIGQWEKHKSQTVS